MQYVEKHYQEKLMQAQVAEKFYFTKEYFARFSAKIPALHLWNISPSTGWQLQNELLETDRTVLDIALDNGFSDARGFINAFKGSMARLHCNTGRVQFDVILWIIRM